MGIYIIRVPDIGEGIAEVEIAAWHVKEGDTVAEDQVIADIMTDKASVEVPCHMHGKVLQLGGKVGDVLAVGAELVRLEVEGEGNLKEGASPLPPVGEGGDGGAAPAGAAKVSAPAASPHPNPPPKGEGAAAPAPSAALGASKKSAAAPARAAAPHATRKEGERPLAAPSVRQRALDMGIELRLVAGSGPAGRILHEDLDAFAARGGAPAPGGSIYVERHGEEDIPVIGLRRKIAQKMQESKRRIPHFSYVEEVDVTELEALRARLNKLHGATRGKLTLLPFLVRAMVVALRDFPQINARFDDDAGVVTRYEAVHLGVATQTDGGLMVPVLRHAEGMDLWACAAGIVRIAEGARTGKAPREELSGSTITLTSLGPLGGVVSTPVINHPEVAIVGVNRIVERPMIREGQVVARQLMNLSSSFDHRVVDGMDAARFIQAVRSLLEAPALLFIE
ncbi:dihydrolipoamide acetyltransferase family protein [Comamonas flocculans]|uniref:Dihydrolipoamide acetyltransferase component of pyruvate dehydrogenase complex n=1 Tax=Comamonas flocculans TaxID=2597701 RepID=A0A5B8RX21_9BURK|nr:dihydrolipoamide acetyltransferase family protein [Comamonas flocculans]QEA13212.1 2-oxo acid dehydrogenase subunit E2 [Comamonas flocculans]